ncbi:MAG TPA: hypothetical protein DD727_03010 [Clostridiales bacterium]|nr:hypothetical protein [Clostridiales bacterium]
MPEVLTGNVRLKVPFVSQWPELPTGCEITAAAMLLQYYGLPADKYDMAWNYLDINSYFYYDEFGVLFGPDPNDYFIGDPETFGGYGCFAPVIVRSMNRYLQDRNSSLTAYNMTGCLFSDLIGWLEKGMPVLVWASGYMTDLFISDSWMLPSGERFTWPGNEHCLVLTGYDENGLWFNDPLMDQEAYGILQYSAEAFATYWQFLGRQTILIR